MAIDIGTTGRFGAGSVEIVSYDMLQSQPAQGILHRRLRAPNPIRTWRIVLRDASDAEKTAIENEFTTAKGTCGNVLFKPPGASVNHNTRFVSPELLITRKSANAYDITFDLIEDVAI